ncbi:MAG TPA: efflux RND transporter periplasmic adaptor subunit [Stellaceae bacterium]|jgi:membrane fusion protein (multidrug efflux system)|nr:efflux RND transporter periplasmic adaptor subunit [Stellaceae bacterium]
MTGKIIKRMIIMLLIVGVVLGSIFWFEGVKLPAIMKNVLASQANPPQTVSDTVAAKQDWQPQMTAIGSLRAVRGSDLSAQIGGIVSAIHFESGADVPEGALLVELSAADDRAKLDSLKAQAQLAQITYDRDQRQLQAQAVSKQVVDTDEQTLKSDLAQVAEQQATVDYKTIRAPFAGRIGIRQVDVGQYLAPGTAIVTLQALDPIFIDFNLPQQALAQIVVGQIVSVTVDTFPGQHFPGKISAINSKVDLSSRNVQVRATLDNHDHKLLPGMFASVAIDVGDKKSYITLPQTAVTYNPYGNTVYIVDDKGKDDKGQDQQVARQVFVTTGDVRGDQVAIIKGVNAGETVVTGGQIKLRNGSPLKINNSVQPTDDANPTPDAEQ